MAFIGPPDDRLAVRERYDAYADAVCRADVADYLSCWTTDGVRRGVGGDCDGTDELRSHFRSMFQTIDAMAFLTQVGAIEIDGDVATARAWCRELIRFADGTDAQVVGRYDDELRRVNGEWRFAVRRYTLHLA